MDRKEFTSFIKADEETELRGNKPIPGTTSEFYTSITYNHWDNPHGLGSRRVFVSDPQFPVRHPLDRSPISYDGVMRAPAHDLSAGAFSRSPATYENLYKGAKTYKYEVPALPPRNYALTHSSPFNLKF